MHACLSAPPPPGPEGTKQFITRLLTSFPDLHVTIHDLVAEGNRVAVHLTLAGTHAGEWAGFLPTGRSFAIPEMHLYRVEGGKLAERRFIPDAFGICQQLGVIPAPAHRRHAVPGAPDPGAAGA